MADIEYSEKYEDDHFEYRYVSLSSQPVTAKGGNMLVKRWQLLTLLVLPLRCPLQPRHPAQEHCQDDASALQAAQRGRMEGPGSAAVQGMGALRT